VPGLNGFDRAASAEDRKHAKRYDAWFRSLPKVQQERMREMGAGPYCEAISHDHVFPIYESAKVWSTERVEQGEELEQFVSREEVARIVHDVVEMLGYTDDPKVLRHWELMRLVLRAPGHKTGKQIGEMFGVTKQAISYLAKRMLARIDRRRRQSIDAQLASTTQEDFGCRAESIPTPPHAVASPRRRNRPRKRAKTPR
jgi:hypothetical protein